MSRSGAGPTLPGAIVCSHHQIGSAVGDDLTDARLRVPAGAAATSCDDIPTMRHVYFRATEFPEVQSR